MTKSTAPRTLAEHIDILDAAGLLVRIDKPINKDSELHPLVRLQFLGGIADEDRKAFLFTNVVDAKGRKYDMPVLLGALSSSREIYAMGMGCAPEEIGDRWQHAMTNPIAPVEIGQAPCQQVVISGDELKEPGGGVGKLPVPVSTPGFDAAPYLTATLCITKDPDSGVQNMGMYRAALKAPDRLAVRMVARPGGAGGWLHWLKYRERKEKMPIAIVVGAAPVVAFTSPQKMAIDTDELAISGGLAGEAIETIRCKTVDLQVPANAEIVIEGEIEAGTLEPEAPFGESNGYVALESFNMPMRVTAITHRKDAVFNAIISQVTPSESSMIKKVAYEPLFLRHLSKELSIKGIREVAMHEPLTNLRPIVFLKFDYGTPTTEIWRGLQGASTLLAYCGKIVVAVSDDIDLRSVDAILWSIAYRSKPHKDALIIPNKAGAQGSQYEQGDRTDSCLLIDATRKRDMAPLALPRKEYMQRAQQLWAELDLPELRLNSPWHGYTLGHWTDEWERFARRTVAGDWEENGRETLARQRDGLEAETAVWVVEPEDKKT